MAKVKRRRRGDKRHRQMPSLLNSVWSTEQLAGFLVFILFFFLLQSQDGLINCVTCRTRQLGLYRLFPHVIPEPHVSSLNLTNEDELVLIANGPLFQVLTPAHVLSEIRLIPNPVVAAKRLIDLARVSFGSKEQLLFTYTVTPI